MGRPGQNLGSYGRNIEVGPDESQEQLVVKPIKSWQGYIWDTWDLPMDQRWLLFKVDAFVLTFASVSFRTSREDDRQVC
jgi:hypothetical protein